MGAASPRCRRRCLQLRQLQVHIVLLLVLLLLEGVGKMAGRRKARASTVDKLLRLLRLQIKGARLRLLKLLLLLLLLLLH